jgi:NADPH:quinone reductase
MKAIQISETGGPEVLRYEEIPTPEPKADEVLVRIQAIGINFVDIYKRTGKYALDLPATLGEEAAGVIEAAGAGVSEVKPGDRIAYANQTGSYAEFAIVPTDKLIPVPDEIDIRIAAAAMLQGMTAHYLSCSTFPIHEGHTALIHAAAGGVGQLLTQLVKNFGGRVIGTVSTEEKAQLALDAGADEVIVYTRQDFETETLQWTAGKGVDVVYDSVGKTTFEKSMDCLKPRGYLVLYGQASGPVSPIDPQILNRKGSIFLTRPSLVHYIDDPLELIQRSRDLFKWIHEGSLKVKIDQIFPLSEAAEAHRYMEARKSKGKVLLIP